MANSSVALAEGSAFKIADLSQLSRFPVPGMITFSTIHGFKGLENSYIILTDIERMGNDEFKSLLYVGMSRAKVALVLLVDQRAREEYHELLKRKLKEETEHEKRNS